MAADSARQPKSTSVRAGGATVIAIGVLTYLLLPGHPDLPLRGIPLGLTGTVVASVAVVAAILGRRVPMTRAVTLGSNGMTIDRPERLVSLLLRRWLD